MRVYLIGYPGDVGGANTEALDTVLLWRRVGLEVHLVPTWTTLRELPGSIVRRLDAAGCVAQQGHPEHLERVEGLAGSICVAFCNDNFLSVVPTLRQRGCRLVWSNCMTFMFPSEKKLLEEMGPFDAYHFQSRFQRSQLEPVLYHYGYQESQGHLIHGAFDLERYHGIQARAHEKGEHFFLGKVARSDQDKWSSRLWPIWEMVAYPKKKGLALGCGSNVLEKLGPPPNWVSTLPCGGLPIELFYQSLHCLFTINGGARENWPRVGLEAMAAGVPIVTQNDWGWKEMIEHRVSGLLGDSDEELAHHAATLAHDEEYRQEIIAGGRRRLAQLADPEKLGELWLTLFRSLA